MKTNPIIQINQKGFSLAEIMVSIFILSITVTAIFLTQANSLSAAITSKEYLIASELAQEGIEIVRNIRDTNWLYHSGSKRSLTGTAGRDHWNDGFDGSDSLKNTYSSGLKNATQSTDRSDILHYFIPIMDYTNSDSDVLFTWGLEHIYEPSAELSEEDLRNFLLANVNQYTIYKNENASYPGLYLQDSTFSSATFGLEETQYTRLIEIKYLESYDNSCTPTSGTCALNAHDNIVHVRSIVAWKDVNDEKKSALYETTLTDWFRRESKN